MRVSTTLIDWENYIHEAIQGNNPPPNALEAEVAKNKLATAFKLKLMIAEYTLDERFGLTLISKPEFENHIFEGTLFEL
jgi:hypothetical protein